MSLKEWLQSANKYAKNGFSKQQVIKELGEPPGRITSNGRGGWKARTGNRKVQDAKRRNFDSTSTPLAAYEAKQLDSTKKEINGNASMYGLEPTQIEHVADQDDAKLITAGAPGDPDNKLIVKESDARFKDKVKLAVGSDYAVVNNPSEESVKIIHKKFFDPIADPDTLPGTNIRNLEDLRRFHADSEQELEARRNAASNWSMGANAMREVATRAGKRVAKNGVPFAGSAFSAENTGQRLQEFIAQPNISNGAQLAASGIETGANFVSDVALSTGIGAPLAAPAEAVANGSGLVDEALDLSEQLMSR